MTDDPKVTETPVAPQKPEFVPSPLNDTVIPVIIEKGE